jgi:hypothetical protein
MKKVGIVIFAVALVAGLVVTNMFSFGRIAGRGFEFPFHIGSVHGSGTIVSDTRDLNDFHAVDVGGIFQVGITAQKQYGVEIQTDDNLLPLIRTHVDNDGVLHIESERRIKSDSPIRVRITAPDIDNLDVSGAANVTVNDLKNTGLSVDSSGASKIKIAGETAKLTIDVSGATKVDAEDLKAASANIDASGASNVTVNVSGRLTTDTSGASRVTYAGSPTSVEKKSSGASSVSAK